MTPLEKARTALTLAMGRHGSMDKALEAAITAYLTALPEDAGTVEKVAAALDGNAWRDKTHGPLGKAQKAARRSTARQNARAALTALASRDERK